MFSSDGVFFIADDKEIFTVGEMIRLYPELQDVVDYQMPEGTGMEDDGTGNFGNDDDGDGEQPAEEPAAKRAKAKAAGQSARTAAREAQGKPAKKSTAAAQVTASAMAGAIEKTMEKIVPTLQALVPKTSAARLSMEESENACMKLALSNELRTNYEKIVATLAEQKAQPVVDDWYVGLLERQLASTRARMEKDASEEL